MNRHSSGFDLDSDLITLETIPDFFGKKIYLTNKIIDFKQFLLRHPDFTDNKYLESLYLEEERLDLTTRLEEKRQKKLRYKSDESSNLLHPGSDNVSENPDKQSKRKIINDHLIAADILKWEYFFEVKTDYLLALDILTDFFADRKMVTGLNIEMQIHSLTNFCRVMNVIYHELCPRTLKNNKDFYNVLRNFSILKNKSNTVIYSILKS